MAMIAINEINIDDYDYLLPDDRIAQHPVEERDRSKLLIYNKGITGEDIFRNAAVYLPANSLLVFNNTRVIRARILFRKASGSAIEILCLEPESPSGYETSLGSQQPVVWKCIVGNLKKWKQGPLSAPFQHDLQTIHLNAENLSKDGETSMIRFSWDHPGLTFGEVIEKLGHIPLPPYINRSDTGEDALRYQTVYSKINGSVAAPTAGLHFTGEVMNDIGNRGIRSAELTLHVGAGTFKPVKENDITKHEMHCEHFFVRSDTLAMLRENLGNIIAVGTTSVRTLESLYWLGAGMKTEKTSLTVDQWTPYTKDAGISAAEALENLEAYMKSESLTTLEASTSIIIVPGYRFRIINGLFTNFHQPRSTLLLLVSAWTGEKWKDIYNYAMDKGFRFLSYGDSSLLL